MRDQLEIVTLPETDWPAFKEIRLRALRDAPQAFAQTYASAAAYPDSLWRERLREAATGQSWIVFARLDGALVGMLGAFRTADDRAHGRATIYGTFVDPAARRSGVGRRLMAALLAKLAADPEVTVARLSVNATQLAAVRLYEAVGFRMVGEEVTILGDGQPHRELILDKPLP
jgi:ribosomal protein S18 acetylase RimI-like enzyme